MDSKQSSKFVNKLSEQNRKFCIIGLTGKICSGTSDVCRLLTSPDFSDNVTQPANTTGFSMSEIREHKVIYRYLHHHWQPFVELRVTSAILTFLMDSELNVLENNPNGNLVRKSIEKILSDSIKNPAKFQSKILEKIVKADQILCYNQDSALTSSHFKILEKKSQEFVKKAVSSEIIWSTWRSIRACLDRKEFTMDSFIFCYGVLPALKDLIKKDLGDGPFTTAFQYFGNRIRASGSIITSQEKENTINAEKLFALSERINQFVKILRHYPLLEASSDTKPPLTNPVTFVIINNFKNIFETYYFKKRYSAFYLMAVSCDDQKRQAKFGDIVQFKLADLKENLSSGKKLFNLADDYIKSRKKTQESETDFINRSKTLCEDLGVGTAEFQFIKEIFAPEKPLRRIAYESKTASFILQDVMTCIENADIFVTRNREEADYKCDYPLIRSLGRIVTLILHPGLLTPTKLERCMQIAMTAKLNSGCLSRQVGAVVTDSEYNILSLGWNDAPCGVESCLRRNLFDLLRKHDSEAYSKYELDDPTFRAYLDKINSALINAKENLNGLPMAFCFKDIYQDIIKQRDQIYTRALHGEERALAACGNERAKGGYLFTTSSPCELCAKKAKEANISKIYYIEQYPGISHSHVIEVGDPNTQAQYEFFVGAVGSAYVRFYTPLIPYKDELDAIHFYASEFHKNALRNENRKVSSANGSEKMHTDFQEYAGFSLSKESHYPCQEQQERQ